MTELKPCPFCGEKPTHVSHTWDSLGNDIFWVYCGNLGCKVNPECDAKYSEEAAAEAWNTRADERPEAYWGRIENGKILNCSACGAKYRNSGISEVMRQGEGVFDYEEPRFCPHCGARMEIFDE